MPSVVIIKFEFRLVFDEHHTVGYNSLLELFVSS